MQKIEITQALEEITTRGLDKFRCRLTGAPYATIDSSEIIIALQAELEYDPQTSVDRLIDSWELKALTFNTQTLPSLRGVKEKALMPLIRNGHQGQVKTLTYLLTRLLFPHIGSEPMPTEQERERMLFAIHLYDSATAWEVPHVAGLVQQLAVIDSYCAMPYWHTLWAFDSAASKLGIDKAPKRVQETFADPLRVTEDSKRVDEIIKYLYELMIYVTERDGVAGHSGNRMAQQIMLIHAQHVPQVVIPHFQKKLSEADRIRMENRQRLESKKETRIAHSAIMGKGTPLNYHDNPMWQMANRIKKDLAAQRKDGTAPVAEKKSKVKVDSKFAAAFNAVLNK